MVHLLHLLEFVPHRSYTKFKKKVKFQVYCSLQILKGTLYIKPLVIHVNHLKKIPCNAIQRHSSLDVKCITEQKWLFFTQENIMVKLVFLKFRLKYMVSNPQRNDIYNVKVQLLYDKLSQSKNNGLDTTQQFSE